MILLKHGALANIKWPVHPESTMAVSCGLRSGRGRQSLNILLLFKVAAPAHHSLLVLLPTMLSALVASRLRPFLGKL
jgi:hypothetical protein